MKVKSLEIYRTHDKRITSGRAQFDDGVDAVFAAPSSSFLYHFAEMGDFPVPFASPVRSAAILDYADHHGICA